MPKILVIDDDPLVRSTIARLLSRAGYDFVLAGDGKRGLELFESEQPELVITDLIMPEKEGIETIRAIREMRPEAKIIAISGGGRLGNLDLLKVSDVLKGHNSTNGTAFDGEHIMSAGRTDRSRSLSAL
jgi:two-component system chemotaxis response regulator CheY